MAEVKKFTKKQAQDLLAGGYITDEQFEQMVADGKVATGVRQAKGTVLGMYNADGILTIPSLYFKHNKGGVNAFTPEMKELQTKVKALLAEYCEEIEVESQKDAADDDSDDAETGEE